MKKEIHPQYFPKATIKCACGNTMHMGSIRESMEVEICAKCHPFYTGKEKLVDTAGRVDTFKRRMAHAKPKRVLKRGSKQRK